MLKGTAKFLSGKPVKNGEKGMVSVIMDGGAHDLWTSEKSVISQLKTFKELQDVEVELVVTKFKGMTGVEVVGLKAASAAK